MLEKIKERVIPYFIGFCFMVIGWYRACPAFSGNSIAV